MGEVNARPRLRSPNTETFPRGFSMDNSVETSTSTFRPDRVYGRCRGCNGLGVYFNVPEHSYHYLDGRPHEGHDVDFMPDSSLAPANPIEKVSDMTPPKVAQRITDVGFYYRLRSGGEELGCFTVEDEENPELDQTLASKLGVDVKDVLAARLYEIRRPTTFDELDQTLGSSIRHDKANKLILLCAACLTFTDEDQFNILMSGESAGGKSYSAQEVASFIPSDVVRWIGGASPSSFYHMQGTWDEEKKAIHVDLRQKLLVFLDSPHYSLLEKLRPLLSHDRKQLAYQIVDKNKSGALRTKNVILEGYPTVIFCSGRLTLDEQERTRVFLLSPETDQEKLQESILLRIKHDGDRQAFKHWINTHPRRRWLKARIDAIRAANVDQIIIEDQEAIYRRFLETHSRLAPRHQRDISRILALIKAHALLNWCQRERRGSNAIIANQEDVDAGFGLYQLVAKPNELGLAPQLYTIWDQVIRPLVERYETGVPNRTIMAEYHHTYGRFLPDRKLRREILPALESCGLIILEADPTDRRQKLVTRSLSDMDAVKGNVGAMCGGSTPQSAPHPHMMPTYPQDRVKQPTGPLDTIISQTETVEKETEPS